MNLIEHVEIGIGDRCCTTCGHENASGTVCGATITKYHYNLDADRSEQDGTWSEEGKCNGTEFKYCNNRQYGDWMEMWRKISNSRPVRL